MKHLTALIVFAACLVLPGARAFAAGDGLAPARHYNRSRPPNKPDPSEFSSSIIQALEQSAAEVVVDAAGTTRARAERNMSAGRTLGGVIRGDEVTEPTRAVSTESSASTFIACVCIGLLGLIGYRLKRRCR